MRDLFTPQRGPCGYHCPDCGHAWDATTPNPTEADFLAAWDRTKDKGDPLHCPECGVIGMILTVSPERYSELKGERVKAYIAGLQGGTVAP